MVAIDIYQRGNHAKKFIDEKKLTYHLLETHLGGDDPIKGVFNVQITPMNMIIDSEGRILYLHSGYEKGDEKILEEQVKKVLGI